MEEPTIDRETIGRLFLGSGVHSQPRRRHRSGAATGGGQRVKADIKAAPALFLKLRPADRQSALATLTD